MRWAKVWFPLYVLTCLKCREKKGGHLHFINVDIWRHIAMYSLAVDSKCIHDRPISFKYSGDGRIKIYIKRKPTKILNSIIPVHETRLHIQTPHVVHLYTINWTNIHPCEWPYCVTLNKLIVDLVWHVNVTNNLHHISESPGNTITSTTCGVLLS